MASYKSFVIATLIAFAAGPIWGSIAPFFGGQSYPPIEMGTSIGEPKAGTMGVNKDNSYMPEIQITDSKPRPMNFGIQSKDGPEGQEPFDFPAGTQ